MNPPPTCPHCHQPLPIEREGSTISQIEKEKRETAYYLNEVWPAICGEADSMQEENP